ncbi:MAG: O-antigen ligase family protein [Alphaproteobacteria bacterium]|nr:O-antigen ligase family protein [Alphaproteobacteria bacterium]
MLPGFPWAAAWFVAAVLVWAGASALWSIAPGRSLMKLLDLVLVGGAALLLFGAERRVPPRDTQAFGLVLACAAGLFYLMQWNEIITDGALIRWLSGLPASEIEKAMAKLVRGISLAALVTWSALICLHRARRTHALVLLGALALATLWATTAAAAALAATLGAVAAVIVLRLGAGAVRWLGALAATWVLIAPLVLGGATHLIDPYHYGRTQENISTVHRLAIWRFATEKIAERPLLGYGLRAARDIPGARDKIPLGGIGRGLEFDMLSVHPHNGPLEWWLELGLPGALLGALAVFLLFRWPARIRDPVIRALLVGQLTTAFGIFSLSFGIWQTWWLMALVLSGFLSTVALQGAELTEPGARAAPEGGGLARQFGIGP